MPEKQKHVPIYETEWEHKLLNMRPHTQILSRQMVGS